MGVKVQFDNYLPGYYSMRDLNHNTNGTNWPGIHGDNNTPNGQYYYGLSPKPIEDALPGYDNDHVKRTLLRHEAVFQNQVFELHRLYKVQKDLMDEVIRNEQYKQRIHYETSSSSSAMPSQFPSEDSQRHYPSSFFLANSCGGQPPVSGPEIIQFSSIRHHLKGKSAQASPVMLENCSLKNSEASESRPTKLRKKMFDLQLPADEYIDTDEMKLCRKGVAFDHCEMTNYQENGSSSDSFMRKPNALADLNEPVQSDEAIVNPSEEILRMSKLDVSAEFHGWSKDVLWNSKHGNLNRATVNLPHNTSKGKGPDWLSVPKAEGSKGSVRSTHQDSQPDKVAIPSHSTQIPFDNQCQTPWFFPQNQCVKEGPWPGRMNDSFKTFKRNRSKTFERNHSFSGYHNPEQVMDSYSKLPPYVPPSELANSWDHSISSWGKSNSSLSQKSTSEHIAPSYNSACLNESSQFTDKSNELFGKGWNLNGNPTVNHPGFRVDPPLQNGFYHDSSSGFKDSSLFPFSKACHGDYVNGNYNDIIASGPCKNFLKGTSPLDLNMTRDLNLNMVLPNGLSDNEQLSQPRQGIEILDVELKQEDSVSAFPWHRAKSVSSTGGSASAKDGPKKPESCLYEDSYDRFNRYDFRNASDVQNCNASTSCDVGDLRSKEHPIGCSSSSSSRKILGVPIFQKPLSQEEIQSGRRKPMFDINMPCDPLGHDFSSKSTGTSETVVAEQKAETTLARCMIDLNLCVETEDEVPLRASVTNSDTSTTRSTKRVGRGTIDLEAPIDHESEDEYVKVDQELLKAQHQLPSHLPSGVGPDHPEEGKLSEVAAEAIVAISSSSVQPDHSEEFLGHLPVEEIFTPEHPLLWFADIISSHPDSMEVLQDLDTRGKDDENKDYMSSESDDFESLTLKLKDCSSEEYLNKPSVFEIPSVVEDLAPTPVLKGRPRRGPPRRGRQRRDFQRDILPSLASLSRHEVTEDLQTFGGLMWATGHAWQCGSWRNAARNGSGRRRRKSVATVVAPSPVPVRTTNTAATTTASITTACSTLPKQQQVKNGEINLEDRSFTSWGKMTRRPRRQRCPLPLAGNSVATVPLT